MSLAGGSDALVERWLVTLRDYVGLSSTEQASMVVALDRFCVEHGMAPDRLLADWMSISELTVRRREPGRPVDDRAVLAVESFLIHSGVNIFGDIVCMPRSRAALAEQGARFDGRMAASDPPADPGAGSSAAEA